MKKRLALYAPLQRRVGGQKGGVDHPPIQQQVQKRPLGIRETPEFLEIAHRVREGLRAGHSYEEHA